MDQTLKAASIFRPKPPAGKRVLGSRAVRARMQGTVVLREGLDICMSPIMQSAVVTNEKLGSQIEGWQIGRLDRGEEGRLESV
jgi:hypothetical protein